MANLCWRSWQFGHSNRLPAASLRPPGNSIPELGYYTPDSLSPRPKTIHAAGRPKAAAMIGYPKCLSARIGRGFLPASEELQCVLAFVQTREASYLTTNFFQTLF